MQSYLPLVGGPAIRAAERNSPGSISVNMASKRFMNESMPYVEACHHMYSGEYGQVGAPARTSRRGCCSTSSTARPTFSRDCDRDNAFRRSGWSPVASSRLTRSRSWRSRRATRCSWWPAAPPITRGCWPSTPSSTGPGCPSRELASEFRYRDPVLDRGTLVVAISQSGETADTLEAVRHAKQRKAKVLAICNTNGSQIPRECDAVLYTRAGPEIGVAATRTFLAQIAAT